MAQYTVVVHCESLLVLSTSFSSTANNFGISNTTVKEQLPAKKGGKYS